MIKNLLSSRSSIRRKKGFHMILEFIFILPFLIIVILMLFDVLKFYYTYNAATFAAYHSSYNFSMTTNVKSAMDRGQELLAIIGINEERFKDNNVVKAHLYKYDRTNKSFGHFYEINENKTSVSCTGEMRNLTCGKYDNQRMRDREIWGVRFTIQNKLISTIPLKTLSAGAIPEITIPVYGYNHVFELQRFDPEF